MKLTDALLGEHAVLYALFDHLRDTTLESDDMAEIHGVRAVVEKLLASHARIEDELLFPQLEPHLGPMGPLAVMRAEHSAIDDLLAAAGQESDIAALKDLIGQLLELAHGHFQKEEMVLFGMARQCLDEATLTGLADEWAARRNVTGLDHTGAA
jgi:hemerythrin-like domain-containing protein